MHKLGLGAHAEALVDAGYDDWEQVMCMGAAELEELTDMLGFQTGHRARLKQHVHNARVLAKKAVASAADYHDRAKRLFACMDLDGDGFVTQSALRAFLEA